MPKLYVIAGCNGAGKTTASYAVLPEMLNCHDFVNADEIAKGLSPFDPARVSIEAGRLMRNRMDALMSDGADFAFETTLATRYYTRFIRMAQERGYFVSLLYFWLPSAEQAVERVARRVAEGELKAEDISEQTIAQSLMTETIPDPDLIIRTSGECRLSNFLLWQASYAEFYFPEVLWPDFDEEEFAKALEVYAQRERRYGLVTEED